MAGERTPVAQRIKPTKKSVLVLNRFSAIYALARRVWARAETRVQAGILMSLQFDLWGDIGRKFDRSQMSRKY